MRVILELLLVQPFTQFRIIGVQAVERHMIQRPCSSSRPGHRNAQPVAVRRIGVPVRDMDDRCVSEIQPMSQESQIRSKSLLEPQHVAIEITGAVHVVGHDQEMFHLAEHRQSPSGPVNANSRRQEP